MSKYQNKDVTVIRALAEGDKDFDPAVAKVVVKNKDGSTSVAVKSEVTE